MDSNATTTHSQYVALLLFRSPRRLEIHATRAVSRLMGVRAADADLFGNALAQQFRVRLQVLKDSEDGGAGIGVLAL